MNGLINRAIDRFARDTYGDALWEEEIDRLEARHEEMCKKLEELRHSSDDAWDDIMASAERAWDSLSDAIEKVRSRFKWPWRERARQIGSG